MTQTYRDLARNDVLTIESAIRFLEVEATERSFEEILANFGDPGLLRKQLIDGLKKNHPGLEKGSVEKRVRGWYAGKHQVKKADAIELCYILGLSLEKADSLVAFVSEEKLHWRDPDEIVDIYALAHGYTYAEAIALKKRMGDYLLLTQENMDSEEECYTFVIRKEVAALRSEEELKIFLRDSAGRLGKLHNNAFRLFSQRLATLTEPEIPYPLMEGEKQPEKMNVRDILREYMFENNVSYAKERARLTKKGKVSPEEGLILSTIQKKVSENWPDETTISKMKSRKIDVTRKALILLLMATEEGFRKEGPEYDEEDDDYVPTKEEVFDDIYGRLNRTLEDCGFSALDPRSPFDWMILYSICAQEMPDADKRMRDLFRAMFGEREEEEDFLYDDDTEEEDEEEDNAW